MKTSRKFVGLMGAAVILFACLGAGVTGLFTQVNSTNGYQVNGGAGSSGQLPCSNGTYFAVPCSVVSSITDNSTVTGAMTFSGLGVAQSGNTFTFAGLTLAGTQTGCNFPDDGNGYTCSITVTIPSGMPDTAYVAVCYPRFSAAISTTQSAAPSIGLGWTNTSTTTITVNEALNNGSSTGFAISPSYGITVNCVAYRG